MKIASSHEYGEEMLSTHGADNETLIKSDAWLDHTNTRKPSPFTTAKISHVFTPSTIQMTESQ